MTDTPTTVPSRLRRFLWLLWWHTGDRVHWRFFSKYNRWKSWS